jgi:hypothetical protein
MPTFRINILRPSSALKKSIEKMFGVIEANRKLEDIHFGRERDETACKNEV